MQPGPGLYKSFYILAWKSTDKNTNTALKPASSFLLNCIFFFFFFCIYPIHHPSQCPHIYFVALAEQPGYWLNREEETVIFLMKSIVISLALGAFMLRNMTHTVLIYSATSGLWSVSLLLRRSHTISDSSSVIKINRNQLLVGFASPELLNYCSCCISSGTTDCPGFLRFLLVSLWFCPPSFFAVFCFSLFLHVNDKM